MAQTLISNRQIAGGLDGWIPAGETWTYASADSPTFTFTISGDKTSKYSVGMKLKLTQTTIKYFIITAISYSSPNTTVTVYGGTDYTLANAAITSPYYSMVKSPFGFPISPDKWQEIVIDTSSRTLSSPASGWINLNSASNLIIPIGSWNVKYKGCFTAAGGDTGRFVTLSNSSTGEDRNWTCFAFGYNSHIMSGIINVSSKTTYYLNMERNSTLTSMGSFSNGGYVEVSAICAYL